MHYDLKTPCKHCPFRTDETAIRFSCRERAEEIEESAYRNGFPCHRSAEHVDADDDPFGHGGFYPGKDTQHCAGALIMYVKSWHGAWPGIENDEDLFNELEKRLDLAAPVFDSADDFLDANSTED